MVALHGARYRGSKPCAIARCTIATTGGSEHGHQRRPLGRELRDRKQRQAPQNGTPLRRQLDHDAAPVAMISASPHHISDGQTIDQLDRAVVTHLESLREHADLGWTLLLQALQLQEQ